MNQQPMLFEPEIAVVSGRKFEGRVVGVLATTDPADFDTQPVEFLDLGLEGVAGDRHHGFVRASSSREPWHPRGTSVRNDRQLSLLSVEDLAEISRRLNVADTAAGWIGGNIVFEGIPRLSWLPRGTRLFFSSGAVVYVEDQNGPCRIAGRAIVRRIPDRPDIELGFPKEAKGLRGVVASVERAGQVKPGDVVKVMVPEQWIYPA
ncbi:MOSC domain-containing protein [Segnochrobactrum spirostomi]|nr:MOSC domain-containing protein [Segnochrobactrum spirostomi]